MPLKRAVRRPVRKLLHRIGRRHRENRLSAGKIAQHLIIAAGRGIDGKELPQLLVHLKRLDRRGVVNVDFTLIVSAVTAD